ncbi:MAG: sigma-54-dependent transcriptional regulator [Flavobacteriales bacterium]
MDIFKDKTILILDDDSSILFSLDILLKPLFKTVITTSISEQTIENIESFSVDILLMDMNYTKGMFDGVEGKTMLQKIKKNYPFLPIVIMTAYSEVNLAVECMKIGATDFINKPWQNQNLLLRLQQALNLSHQTYYLQQLRNTKTERVNLKADLGMIGDSPAIKKVRETILKVAKTDANVLILGENGTGKELVAKALHEYSDRKDAAFVKIDLGSISASLFESELYGSKKGAYTGSTNDKIGRLELANSGTLFLDELGNLHLDLQSKLLSSLQNREITPVGSTKSKSINVRLISATNLTYSDLKNETIFRTDLLYRVNTIEIVLPPLRDRKQDISLLMDHFLELNKVKHRKPSLYFSNKSYEQAKGYLWPGNIRELEHIVERAVLLNSENEISLAQILPNNTDEDIDNIGLNIHAMEEKLIKKALKVNEGNISKAAKDLGLTRPALYRRLEKFGL